MYDHLKKICLYINLKKKSKKIKNLYPENYKMLMDEINKYVRVLGKSYCVHESTQ